MKPDKRSRQGDHFRKACANAAMAQRFTTLPKAWRTGESAARAGFPLAAAKISSLWGASFAELLLIEVNSSVTSPAPDHEAFMKLGLCASLCLVCGEVLFVSQPSAQEHREFPSTSGNAFVRLCSVVEKDEHTQLDTAQGLACIGYVEGIVDGVLEEVAFAHAVTDKEPPKPFCLAKDVENGQLIRVTLKYIRNHPEEAHNSTAFLIAKALQEAFPCSATRK